MTKYRYVVKNDPTVDPPWKTGGPPAEHLDIELTERCNNACIHCCINRPAGDKRSRARELDAGAWKGILRQTADLGVLTVRFTGGEPLLRDDFPELYLYARRLGLKVLLFTNARLITPEIATLLAEIPPLEEIEISVYGMRRESYEAVTGVEGSYTGFRNGVQCLLDRKIPFVVKGALLPPNKKEMAEFAAWAATNPRMDTPPAYAMFFDLRGRRDSAAKNSRIRRLRVSPEEGLEILMGHPDPYRKEMAQFFENFLPPPGDRLFTCGIGPGCVDAYGVFQPCLSLRHPDLTLDLKNSSLKAAITSVLPRLKEMRATNPLYLERCARCFLRGFCEQCPAKSWSEHGTLDTPVHYFCRVAHAQARFLGLVREEERAWDVRDSKERIENLKKERDGIMKKIRMEMIFSHSSDVVSREIDGALIIVPLTAGVGDMEDDLFSMNDTGTEIWKLLDGHKTLKEAVAVLEKKYQGSPDEIERDVAGIVEELLKRRMIVNATTA